MIDPKEPPEVQVARQAKIIAALMRRASRQHDVSTNAYSLFQSAIALQNEVWAKTRDLEEALDTLGRASSELALVRLDREQLGRHLADAVAAMEGAFALFADGRLQTHNDFFRTLVPDLTERIVPGLALSEYFSALAASRHVAGPPERLAALAGSDVPPAFSFLLELARDRWFQFSQQRTPSGNNILQLTDITGLVRANRLEKKQLIDMQAHYLQAAFDHMPYGVATFSADGLVMLCNARFGALLGLSVATLHKGTTLAQVLGGLRRAHGRFVSEPGGPRSWRSRIERSGSLDARLRYGSGRVLDLHFDRLPDGGLLATATDVTLETQATELLEARVKDRTRELTDANERLRNQSARQARVEEELRVAKEEAEAAVSSKTRFLAAASHDLLQPINAAKLLISTLGEQARGSTLEHTVERLEGAFASTESLLHALLDISRLESTGGRLTATELPLDPLLQSIGEDMAPMAARKGLRLTVLPSFDWVTSDRHYLYRSVQNLVANAIHYTDSGRILVGCRRRGGRVAIQVWDTGIGIDPEDQALVFGEFIRARNAADRGGVGLGLSIVERTCRLLGHRVGLVSTPGEGSMFWIELERVEPPVLHEEPRARIGGHERDLDLIVLVIENDPDVLFATTKRLEAWGASVLPARGLMEARKMVADLGTAPDVILADYQLDGGNDGVEAIEALRRQTGRLIPAIMVTADRSELLVRQGTASGFAVLTKPVQLRRLRALLDEAQTLGAHASIA